MGIIDREEIAGYGIGEEIVCLECVSDEEKSEATLDQIITHHDIDQDGDRIYFCDRCNKQMR